MRPNAFGSRLRGGVDVRRPRNDRTRFSFGYGACPHFEDRAKMMERLQPGRIGVDLSEESQLHLEQSTDAFVLNHREAKYFDV
jgi:5-methyltetrahydrofolate--homocysteine methyltransferase